MAEDVYTDEYEEGYNDPLEMGGLSEETSISQDDARERIGHIDKYLLLSYAFFMDFIEIMLFLVGLGIVGSILGSIVSAMNLLVLFVWFKILGISYFERVVAGKIQSKIIKLLLLMFDTVLAVLPVKTILMYVIIKEVQTIDKSNLTKFLRVVDEYL